MTYPEILKKEPFKIKLSPLHWALESFSVLVILSITYYIVLKWNIIPETIAIHFDLKGNPDSYGGKWTLILLPALYLIIYPSMTLLGRYPHMFNYPFAIDENNYKKQFRLGWLLIFYLKIEITLMFGFLTYKTIRVALGNEENLGSWSPLFFIIIILFTVVFYFYKAYKAK